MFRRKKGKEERREKGERGRMGWKLCGRRCLLVGWVGLVGGEGEVGEEGGGGDGRAFETFEKISDPGNIHPSRLAKAGSSLWPGIELYIMRRWGEVREPKGVRDDWDLCSQGFGGGGLLY